MEGGDLLTNQIDDKINVSEMSYQNSRCTSVSGRNVSIHLNENNDNIESHYNDSGNLTGALNSSKAEYDRDSSKENLQSHESDGILSETNDTDPKEQEEKQNISTDVHKKEDSNIDVSSNRDKNEEETDGAVLSKLKSETNSEVESNISNKNDSIKKGEEEEDRTGIESTDQQRSTRISDEKLATSLQTQETEVLVQDSKINENINSTNKLQESVNIEGKEETSSSNSIHNQCKNTVEESAKGEDLSVRIGEVQSDSKSCDDKETILPETGPNIEEQEENKTDRNSEILDDQTADNIINRDTVKDEEISLGTEAERAIGTKEDSQHPEESGGDHVDGDSEPLQHLEDKESCLKADENLLNDRSTNDNISEDNTVIDQKDNSYADDFEEDDKVSEQPAHQANTQSTAQSDTEIKKSGSNESLPSISHREIRNQQDEIEENSEQSETVIRAAHIENENSMENESETLKSEIEKSTDDNARADEVPKRDRGEDTDCEADEIGSEEAGDGKGMKQDDEKAIEECESKENEENTREKPNEQAQTREDESTNQSDNKEPGKPETDGINTKESDISETQIKEENVELEAEKTESSTPTDEASGNDKEKEHTEPTEPEPELEPKPVKIIRNINIDGAVDTITEFEVGVTELISNMKELLDNYHERLGHEPLANFVQNMDKFSGDFSSIKDAYKKCETLFSQLNKSLKDLRHSGEAITGLIDKKIREEDLKMWMESEDTLAEDIAKIKDERIAVEKSAIARASDARSSVAKSAVAVTESSLYAAEVEAETAEAEATAKRAWEAVEIALRVAAEAKKAAEEKRRADEEARKRAEERARQKAEAEQKLQEEEDKKLREESERKGTSFEDEKKKAMEEKARKEAERKNPKNWPRFIHSIEPGDFDPGVGCVIRAIEGSLQRQDVEVSRVDQLTGILKLVENEELISNVIEIKPVDTEKKFTFEEPLSIAIPHCLQRNIPGREPVIKQLQVTSGRWTELPTSDVSFDDIRELRFVEFRTRRFGVFAVILRLKRDTLTFTRKGNKVNSTADARVSFTCRAGMFKNNVNFTCEVQQMEMTTVNDLVRRRPTECQKLLASSPIVRFQIPNRKFNKPLIFTLPLPPSFSRQKRPQTATGGLKEKSEQREARPMTARPTMSFTSKEDEMEEEIHLLVREDRGVWTALPKTTLVQAKNKDIVTFEVTEPHDRFMLLRTKEGVMIPSIEKMAHMIEAAILHRSMHVSLRQRNDDPNDIILVCTPTSRTERVLKKLAEDGYEEGPVSSKEIIVKEGQIMDVQFRGNIHCLAHDIKMSMIFNTYIKSRLEFNVEEIDKFAQKSLHCYRGFAQIFAKAMVPKQVLPADKAKVQQKQTPVEMSEERILLTELLINIPKPESEPPMPLKTAPIRVTAEGPDKEDILQYVSTELGDEWKKLAQYLSLRNVRIQAILRQNNQNPDPKKIRYDMLVTWAKRVPRCMNKLEILAQALMACGRGDLAEELRERDLEYRRRRAVSYRDVYLRRAFVKIAQDPGAVYGWRNIAKHLGVSDEELVEIDQSKPSVQEKCFQSLQKWQSSNGDGATLPILSEKLKLCKYKQLAKDIEAIGCC